MSEPAGAELGDAVHVYHALVEGLPAWRDSARGVLSEDEKDRCARFRFDEHRDAFLIAHCLLRHVLTRHGAAPAHAWRFETTEHGRPEIIGPDLASRLRFNISHTRGLVACAVTRELDVGVDVEDRDRDIEMMSVARRVFSVLECEQLERRQGEARRRRFFDYWTLKEAYIKAVGKGFSMSLRSITLKLEAGEEPAIGFDEVVDGDPEDWKFFMASLSGRHVLATAVRARHRPTFHLTTVHGPKL